MPSRSKPRRSRPDRRPPAAPTRVAPAQATDADHIAALYGHIYAVVRRIPRGHIATYGQVAELAGIPGGARVVGAAMKVSRPEHHLPWQRVVGKRSPTTAGVSIHDPVGAGIQRAMLEAEGVTVSDAGTIKLRDHGWLPGEQSARPARQPTRARPAKAARRKPQARTRRGGGGR